MPLASSWRARRDLSMKVGNDAFSRQNRARRQADAGDRIVELRMPLGLELDEDKEGNVFVKKVEPGSRAAKSGMVFEGDYVAMVSATFGDDMWSARGVGLNRVLVTIKSRNTKPVKLVLEGPNEAEEKKRRAIAFKELSDEEKRLKQEKDDALLRQMEEDDKALRKKRKGLFGLW